MRGRKLLDSRYARRMVGDETLPPDIDVAFNEATWLGAKLSTTKREIALDFDVLTLPEGSGGTGHARVTVHLHDVSRIVASLRLGRWDDTAAEVVTLSLDELPATIAAFGGQPIYGWEFFDLPEDSWRRWRDRLSIDARWDRLPAGHSLELFQEGWDNGRQQHLDVRVWFRRLSIYDEHGQLLDPEAFAQSGRRWWDAMYAGDERTKNAGIVPLKKA
jgi:hypothetical protein